MKDRYGKISIMKFCFAIMVILLHIGFIFTKDSFKYKFSSGSIAVDFFFIVSGFFFCKKYINYKIKDSIGEDTFDFLISKIKRFLIYFIILLLLSIPFAMICLKFSFTDLVNSLYNILYIPHNGKCNSEIFGITWYIIAMVISEVIMFPLLIKYKKDFVYTISPIIILILGSYLLVRFGHFATPLKFGHILYKGLIRGIFEINLGMYLYLISEKFNKVKFTKLSKVLLLLFEIFGYASIFILVNLKNAHRRFDALMIIIISICILLSTNKNLYLYKFSNNKVFSYLEKLSLPMYIYQWLIIEVLVYIFNKINYDISYVKFSLITILISILFSVIILKIVSLYDRNKSKIMKLFIAN